MYLLSIVDSCSKSRGFHLLHNRAIGHGGESGDDCNHHEEFYEGESLANTSFVFNFHFFDLVWFVADASADYELRLYGA